MYPDFLDGKSNLAFEYPEEFEIKFSDALAENLHKIGRCVLNGMDVTYNGQGMPMFFEDTNAPVNVVIKLVFSEVEILTKQHPDVKLD
jgi:hypothetical protein